MNNRAVKELLPDTGIYKSIFDSLDKSAIVLDKHLQIISANYSFYSEFQTDPARTLGYSIHRSRRSQWEIPDLGKRFDDLPEQTNIHKFEAVCYFSDRSRKTMLIKICRIPQEDNGPIFLVTFKDITKQKKAEELLIAQNRINQLGGMLPICSCCKKIRDDKGYWSQIETYLREHSDAEFSHGICPGCAKEFYPQYFAD
jgi:hypothetical protein